jgi:hypothetical protein
MSRELTLANLAEQHVELLPARTVLSLFATGHGSEGGNGDNLGTAVAKMLGITAGGQSAAGPDGADGQPNHND